MNAISYRRPRPRDLDALCQLGRETFIETFGDLYAAHDLEAFLDKTFGADGLPKEYEDPAYDWIIAEDGAKMVGYCKLGPPYLPSPDDGRSKCELRQLYILKAWHGTGIAQHMMDWALDRARSGGWQDMYLSVYTDNIRAQRLYRKYGFEKVGEFQFMVGNHADPEYLFRLRLKP